MHKLLLHVISHKDGQQKYVMVTQLTEETNVAYWNQVDQTKRWENKFNPNKYVVSILFFLGLIIFVFLSIGHIGDVTFQILKQ